MYLISNLVMMVTHLPSCPTPQIVNQLTPDNDKHTSQKSTFCKRAFSKKDPNSPNTLIQHSILQMDKW